MLNELRDKLKLICDTDFKANGVSNHNLLLEHTCYMLSEYIDTGVISDGLTLEMLYDRLVKECIDLRLKKGEHNHLLKLEDLVNEFSGALYFNELQ